MLPPNDLNELFQFYNDYVKLLYSSVQINNELPVEVLFELNAALDHISRKYVYDEPEKVVVEKAFSHLKRSCLDIFKLQVKIATDQFKELRKIDTSIIDNGEFDKKLLTLYHNIQNGARIARKEEGDRRYDKDGYIKSFDLWEPVYENAVLLQEDFYYNKNVEWAKKKNKIYNLKTFLLSLLASFIAGLLTKNYIIQLFNSFIDFLKSAK